MHLSQEAERDLLTARRGELESIAERHSINYNTARRERSRLLGQLPDEERPVLLDLSSMERVDGPLAAYGIPEGVSEDETAPLSIPTPNVLVLSDLHCPHQNALMLGRALYITQTYFPHIRDIVVAGDIFNFSKLSRHPHNGPASSIKTELKTTGAVLRALFAPFDRAWVCSGNHDEIASKKLDDEFGGLEFLIDGALGADRPACKVQVSELDYLMVEDEDPSKRWLLAHPSAYSGLGGKTPSELAQIYQRHTICGHNHVIGMAPSKDAKWIGIDNGHCTDPAFHYYVKRRATKYQRWSAGFTIISDGYGHLFTERFTDFARYGL
jgi:hypothetical protein